MAFPTDMVYIRWEFSWADTEEIQDTGLWCHLDTVAGNPLNWDAACNSIATTAVAAWKTAMPTAVYAPSVTAVRSVVYHYDQPLKVVLNRGEAGFTGPTAWKGTAVNDLPPENTIVTSLYGYNPTQYTQNRGRKRGRMYNPTPGGNQITQAGGLSDGVTGQWAGYTAVLLSELKEPLTIPLDATLEPVVVSRGGKDGSAAEQVTNITHVRCGHVVDTQRRRRNKLPENYVTVAL